ncbi:hypothetical protein [Polymorphospora rubra]|uniref:Uncharacterized protein n=1 Tax=Polymorphospora rubra TaxID=338584 RepID=A0A810MVN3_9ACTN|nr:hypothetical protein [Polymorphospora rubra]BCJ65082.1 hypothetical protein Prubr_21030 [Polymorphospora rubra]
MVNNPASEAAAGPSIDWATIEERQGPISYDEKRRIEMVVLVDEAHRLVTQAAKAAVAAGRARRHRRSPRGGADAS